MKVKIAITVATMFLAGAVQAQNTDKTVDDLQPPVTSQQETGGVAVVKAADAALDPAPAAVDTTSPVAPAEATETVTVAEEPPSGGTIKSGLISLNLKEVELSSVIRLFATLSGANIIVPELDAGVGATKVDVNLKDVEWKPALQAILDGQNLELYEKIPSSAVYSVRKKLPAAEALQNTRTFLFDNADIVQATEMIKGIVGERGQVFAYPQGNTIVVKSTQEILDDVAQIAERIDTPRKQVLIEARILELTDSTDKDRGVDWSQDGGLLKHALSLSPLTFVQKDGALEQIGVSKITPASGDNTYTPELDLNRLTLDAGQVKVLMSALDQIADIQTVSSPKVIVANGEKASIKIITKEPIIVSTPTYSQQGDLQSILYNQSEDGTDPLTGKKRYATYDYGIMLDVTPTIYSEDNIGVHIVPTISRQEKDPISLALTSDQNSPVQTFPVIDEKRVETTFMLADKQTAVIGGLTETTKQDKVTKVPFLSSIPLIKKLFTYTYTGNVQKENVIFVTVSLENGKSFDLEKAVKTSRLTRKQLIRDENNQVIDDRTVDLFKEKDKKRADDEIKTLEKSK